MAGRKPAEAAHAEPAPVAPDAEQLLTVLARMVACLAARCSKGQYPATFRQIAVNELRIATPADVDAVEAWLAAHPRPPGG
jgi:hypothetical protein